MIAVKSHVLKKSTLEGAAALAGDVSGDGAITITDFIQIKAHILGKSQVTPKAFAAKNSTVHYGNSLRCGAFVNSVGSGKASFSACWACI